MRRARLTVLLLFLAWFQLESFACSGVITRGGNEIDVVFPSEKAALAKALKRMKGRPEYGNLGGMSLEQFVALTDRFASSVLGGHPLTFNVAGFFESAANDVDAQKISHAFELALDRQLQGISYRGLDHERTFHAIENAREIFVVTHLKPSMQAEFARYIQRRSDLNDLPMLGFLSLHETATPDLLPLLQLPILSTGGELPKRRELRIPNLALGQTFHFAGGYLDSCLLQSMISVMNSTVEHGNFSNIDFILHADQIYTGSEEILSSFWRAPLQDPADWEEEREDALEAFAEFEFELRELVKDTELELIVQKAEVRNAFQLRHKKTKRTATIRFVSDYKFK